MKVTFANNTLTVVTGINAEVAKNGIADLTTYDEKTKEPLYRVEVAKDTKGQVSKLGLTCNSEVDGKLAVVMVLPVDTTKEDVEKEFGNKLVLAKKYTEIIASNAQDSVDAINEIFA